MALSIPIPMPSVSRELTPRESLGESPENKPRRTHNLPKTTWKLLQSMAKHVVWLWPIAFWHMAAREKSQISKMKKKKRKHAFRSFLCISFIYLAVWIQPIRLNQPAPNTSSRHKSFSYIACRLWNNLPSHVREAPDLKNFVAKLKELKLGQVECRCNLCSSWLFSCK